MTPLATGLDLRLQFAERTRRCYLARTPTLRSFAAPEILMRIAPANLLELCLPYRGYLADRGFSLPEQLSEEWNQRDLAVLLLADDEEMPPTLVEALHVIGNTGIAERIDDLLHLALIHDVDARSVNITPADLAVRIWLRAPKALDELDRSERFKEKRHFKHFTAETAGGGTAPEDLPQNLTALAAQLDEWFERNKRGANCSVDRVVSGDEVRFLIVHGLPCHCESNGKGRGSSPLHVRPEESDLVVYSSAYDELRVRATTLAETRLYLAAFGKHLFGSKTYFALKPKYSLAPLKLRGREALNCRSIEGLESVRLRKIQWAWEGAFRHVEIHRAPDLFTVFALQHRTIPQEPKLIRAVFEVKLTGDEKPRIVRIKPPSSASFGCGGEAELIEQWLREQRFIVAGMAA